MIQYSICIQTSLSYTLYIQKKIQTLIYIYIDYRDLHVFFQKTSTDLNIVWILTKTILIRDPFQNRLFFFCCRPWWRRWPRVLWPCRWMPATGGYTMEDRWYFFFSSRQKRARNKQKKSRKKKKKTADFFFGGFVNLKCCELCLFPV